MGPQRGQDVVRPRRAHIYPHLPVVGRELQTQHLVNEVHHLKRVDEAPRAELAGLGRYHPEQHRSFLGHRLILTFTVLVEHVAPQLRYLRNAAK